MNFTHAIEEKILRPPKKIYLLKWQICCLAKAVASLNVFPSWVDLSLITCKGVLNCQAKHSGEGGGKSDTFNRSEKGEVPFETMLSS